MKITLLPYESCIKIGEELVESWWNWICKDFGLPKEVFGQTFKVKFCDNTEGYFAINNKYGGCYYVPAIFVSYVSHEN